MAAHSEYTEIECSFNEKLELQRREVVIKRHGVSREGDDEETNEEGRGREELGSGSKRIS